MRPEFAVGHCPSGEDRAHRRGELWRLLLAGGLVAIAWAIVIALLALLAVPAGRRFLSEGGNVLDGHLDKIARAAWLMPPLTWVR